MRSKQDRFRWREGLLPYCAVCKKAGQTVGHHILRKQILQRRCAELDLEPSLVLWDTRNRLTVGGPFTCQCHANHHAASRRIPRAVLRHYAPEVFRFATWLNLSHVIEREYPA